jgi:hypothetical protein
VRCINLRRFIPAPQQNPGPTAIRILDQRVVHCAVQPPSMTRSVPVMKPAASEHK